MHFQSIDIFCHVVDNFGDIGFVYRFAREFKRIHDACALRVFVDDLQCFHAMNPEVSPQAVVQESGGVIYVNSCALTEALVAELDVADILLETFACRIPEVVLRAAESRARSIINLEHLSAEPWVEECHERESLLPSLNLKKYYFMPGFTKATGGVVIDKPDIPIDTMDRPARLALANSFLREFDAAMEIGSSVQIGTVFTYLRGFDTLLSDLGDSGKETVLLVFGQKSKDGMLATLQRFPHHAINETRVICRNTTVVFLPFFVQTRYDQLLYCTDFNLVRGEDSLVRAILAGKPFLWNAYLQDNKYQKVKVEALLNRFQEYFPEKAIFDDYRQIMLQFNDAEFEGGESDMVISYKPFFNNLSKIEHATREMSYFMTRNCDLVQKFTEFLKSLPARGQAIVAVNQ